MSLPFNPSSLVTKLETIKGWESLKSSIPYWGDICFSALEETISEYEEWPEDQGFGSSDTTYAVQSFINSIINHSGLGQKFMTSFTPSLSIVEYSESHIPIDENPNWYEVYPNSQK
jgi:hypothetical protein